MSYVDGSAKASSFVTGINAKVADRSPIECRLGRVVENLANLSDRIDTLAERLDSVLGGGVPMEAGVNGPSPPHICKLDGMIAAIEDGLAAKITKLDSVIDRIRL